jgi:hypothetical protein
MCHTFRVECRQAIFIGMLMAIAGGSQVAAGSSSTPRLFQVALLIVTAFTMGVVGL